VTDDDDVYRLIVRAGGRLAAFLSEDEYVALHAAADRYEDDRDAADLAAVTELLDLARRRERVACARGRVAVLRPEEAR
jgi:hypothetical protein